MAAANAAAADAAHSISSIAFFYGPNPPLTDLQAFDVAVVEPDHVKNPQRYRRSEDRGSHELFAYVSLGEVQPSRSWYRQLPKGALRGSNEAWGSRVIDQDAAGWSAFFVNEVIAPLWEQGWRGFFVDTLDSYQLFAKDDAERARQTRAMVRTLRELKRRFPEAKLILNRGFELLPEVAELTWAVAAESLYQGYDAGRGRYRPVPEADRAWLLARMEEVRDRYRLPVIAIDYVDPQAPGARDLARETARRIRGHGFIPWVTDGALASVGISSIEAVPRNVLVVVRSRGGELHTVDAQRYLGMPLNHLGLRYEFVDLSTEALPEMILRGRYAGVVTWLEENVDQQRLVPWLRKRMREGVPVAMFNGLGSAPEPRWLSELGLHRVAAGATGRVSVQSMDRSMMGYEVEPVPERGQEVPVQLQPGVGHSLLRLADERGSVYDAAALTSWGGYVLAPFAVVPVPLQDHARWVVNPLAFLRRALALPDLPVPDVTTEGGRRMLMVHVDGDGFASRAERPGMAFASEVMLNEFLAPYQVPTTVSVIEGEVAPHGLFRSIAPRLEDVARRMFALPWVEGASHSFSHPFNWAGAVRASTQADGGEASYHLELPGYDFSLEREVKGSFDYINTRLMPAHKRAEVFLWTGNCVPPPAALEETYRHGLLNMNGGDTLITESNKTLTAIAGQGIRKGGYYQVFAPNQNENVYTNNWQGPFYGFERVIETFRLTGEPIRFKPINIYYHTYAASKPASIAALHKVYRWALAQRTTPVYGSQYIRKVLDFESTTVARDLASGDLLVRTGGDLRTLRMPAGARPPSLLRSSGVAGIAPGPAGDYLTLGAAQVRLAAAEGVEAPVHVQDANGGVSDVARRRAGGGSELSFTLTANVAPAFALANAAGCRVSVNGKALAGTKDGAAGSAVYRYAMPTAAPAGAHRITAACPA
ncbi:MAG TPA: bifunctional glycoside hydrolase 114/ polysaccharide deacetylase family protein [Noviherbaspirillum sp.]|uniref:bifunctional glycoside hydrolase 114/ polysaccharide deacetylase family protein n=1 Tax=Noviherbaspirillum sp. TaxID=1926288 RepID=UPI002F91F1B5